MAAADIEPDLADAADAGKIADASATGGALDSEGAADPLETTSPPGAGKSSSSWWKFLVSIALLTILAYTQDLSGVGALMLQASPAWMAAAVVAMFAEQTLTAATWAMLLAARGLQVSVGKVIHIFYLSFFLGTWLPSSTGPDFVRAYYLAKHIDGYEAVGSMLLLRFISLLGLGLFAIGGILALPSEVPVEALLLALFLLAGSAGVLIVGFTEGPRRWATTILDAVGLGAVSRIIGKLHDAMLAYRDSPGTLMAATAVSLLVQFLRILTIYCAGRALGAVVPLLDYLVLVPVTTLITLLPISLSGLGVREGAFVYFFTRAGMGEATAFSLGLLVFGLSLVLWVVGAALYWRDRA